MAKAIKCSSTTMYRIKRNIRFHDSSRASFEVQRRSAKISQRIRDELENFYVEYFIAFRDEGVHFVREQYEIEIHSNIVDTTLKNIELTRKKIDLFSD